MAKRNTTGSGVPEAYERVMFNCCASKQLWILQIKVLTYLSKNNSNESISRVTDEDKRKECDFCNPLCQCTGVGRKVLIRCVRGKQNPTHIFGRESKYEKMKLFPTVS
jgi:hypothetical protein